MSEPTVLEEQISDPVHVLDDEDMEELLIDCHAFVERMVARGLPNYLKPEAFKLLERLNKSIGWATLH